MHWTGAQVDALLDDMDCALEELTTPLKEDPSSWDCGPRGKWTAGQHAEHIGRVLALTADRLEAHAEKLRRGTLGRRPWRDPLQVFFVGLVTREPFPRGGKAPRNVRPVVDPDRGLTLARIAEGAGRHRALALSLAPEERERLWFWNPFIPLPWHYTLPEILRVHATHTRHHARLAREAIRVHAPGHACLSRTDAHRPDRSTGPGT